MAIRPGPGGVPVAFFDVTGNPLLGDFYSVPAVLDSSGFQLTGVYAVQLTNTPFGRPIALKLSFGPTQQNTNSSFITPFSLAVDGLTGSSQQYVGNGLMILNRTQ
jgi:hypothetical protein